MPTFEVLPPSTSEQKEVDELLRLLSCIAHVSGSPLAAAPLNTSQQRAPSGSHRAVMHNDVEISNGVRAVWNLVEIGVDPERIIDSILHTTKL